MAQDSSWLRKPMYGVGALLRGYGFGVPLEDEDEDGKKSGKSSGPRYKSMTQQRAEAHAAEQQSLNALANKQVSYGNIKGIEGPVQTTDSGAQMQDTILERALGVGGDNQPALHVERDAAGVPTRVTPNYFMTVDKNNIRTQGLANKWIGAEAIKDRASIIKEALNRQKGQLGLRAAESNTAKASTQATIAEERLINVQIAGDKAQIALTRAKLELAARKDALNTDKTLRTAKEVAAVNAAERNVFQLQKLKDDETARELTKRNKAADLLAKAQEKEAKRLAEIEKQKRKDEKVAFKNAVKAREQDTKDAEQFIKDEATAAKAMAEVVKKEKLAEEKAQKYLLKARMKAFRDLSPADQKILKLRTLGPGGALRMGFDAKFTNRIDPDSPTTRRPGFSLQRALMSLGGGALDTPSTPIPDAERDRLEGPVTDEDWTRMLSPAERGRIMDTLWREAVNNANERKTNAQDEFSILLVDLEKDPSKRMKYTPVAGNTPADIQPLSEDDLLRTLETGEPLGDEPYEVEGLQFKWDRATQKFIRVQPKYDKMVG